MSVATLIGAGTPSAAGAPPASSPEHQATDCLRPSQDRKLVPAPALDPVVQVGGEGDFNTVSG